MKQLTDIEVAKSFAGYFNVEGIFERYAEWQDDKDGIEVKIKRLQDSLDAGGLTRKLRSKKVKDRDSQQKKLITKDPRLFKKIKYDAWLVDELGVTNGDLEAARNNAANKLASAIKDAESFKNEGLPPYVMVRSGSGSQDYYKVMGLKDFAMESFITSSVKEKGKTGRQQREFDRLLITVKEHYGAIPAEMEQAADNVKLTIDFKARLADVLEDMISDSMKKLEGQAIAAESEQKMVELNDELGDLQ